MLRLLAVLAALAILALGPAAAPAADELPKDVQSVVDDFRADGEITPCKHTVQALERTSQLAPSDIAQYSPDFPAAVDAALEERRHEDCGAAKSSESAAAGAGAAPAPTASPGAGGAVTPAPAHGPKLPQATASPTPQPTPAATPPPATPAPAPTPAEPTYTTVAHEDPFPVGLWILAGLLVLSLLAWLVLALLGRTGWGEERLAGPRHAWSEARYRAGGVWSDFTDWLRLGR